MSRVKAATRSAVPEAVADSPASSMKFCTHPEPDTSTATNSPESVSNRQIALVPVFRMNWTTESEMKYTKFLILLTRPV